MVSRNPALRLYGWTGYRRIRPLVLAQGKEPVSTMLTALEKAAMTEDCGPVMGAVLEMMYLSPDRPSIVSAAVFDETRLRAAGDLPPVLAADMPGNPGRSSRAWLGRP